MENNAQQTPPLPPVADSSIPLSNRHQENAPRLNTVAIGLQASRQSAIASTQVHHAPLCPESPYIYSDKGSMCIENQARVPVSACIVTNQLADRIVKLPLRDPKNLSTWWGKRPRLTVGLSDSVARKVTRGVILTWLAIGAGMASIGFGAFGTLAGFNPILTLSCYGFGALLALSSGFFRANTSISAPVVGRSFTMIKGAHPEFLKQFDQYKNRELVEDDA